MAYTKVIEAEVFILCDWKGTIGDSTAGNGDRRQIENLHHKFEKTVTQ
jgi:hypothetical protein